MKLALLPFLLFSNTIIAAQPLPRPIVADSAGSGHSTNPRLSADGTKLIFMSDAANLNPLTPDHRWVQVYRRDLPTGNLSLVSESASGGAASGNCAIAAASTNAEIVAFISDAPDLASGDTNGAQDLFLREMQTGITRLVTRAPDGSIAQGDGRTLVGTALMSRDGKRLFFESTATNLTAEANTNTAFDIFAYHLDSGTNQLVIQSATAPASAPAGGVRLLSITEDGSKLAFLSASSSDVLPSVVSPRSEIFVRDMQNGDTMWVSQLAGYPGTEQRFAHAVICGAGTFVALTATVSNRVNFLFRVEVNTGNAVLIASNAIIDRPPLISRDGNAIVYEDGTNVYRWTASQGVPDVVNVTTNGLIPSSGESRNAEMNTDGTQVCFCSDSAGLTAKSEGGLYQIYCRDFMTGETWIVTQTPGEIASETSTAASAIHVAMEGRVVAFDSPAGDLADADYNRASDVFVRNRDDISPRLESYRSAAAPRLTALGHALLAPFCLSSNGTKLAFTSWDTDGVAGDENRRENAFVADLESGTVMPVGFPEGIRSISISSDGGYAAAYIDAPVNGLSAVRLTRFDLTTPGELVLTQRSWSYIPPTPVISSDGNLIAHSLGYFRLFNGANGSNEYVANVSVQPLHNGTTDALISSDSRFVVFNVGNGLTVFDRQTGSSEAIVGASNDPAISANSRYLAFASGTSVVRRDLILKQDEVVGQNLRALAISGDGRFIAGELRPGGIPTAAQIILLDCDTKQTNIISASTGGLASNGGARHPVISANGRYVAYLTDAWTLVASNRQHKQQVVLRDVLLGRSILLSTSTTGTPGNDHSGRPYVSGDGSTIAFQSMASNLTPGDYNNARDIFVVKLGAPDTDHDGIDDAWEVTYFGDLSRDGDGDLDGDGHLDRAEFLSGTDPTNSESVFRVFTMAQLGATDRTILWVGDPALGYRVEYKDNLGSAVWNTLQSPIIWNGNTARISDPAANPVRFYRAVRLP